MSELLELEEKGWQALSADGDAGRKFYADVLQDDAVMLFPGGMQINGRERILQSLGNQPWETFRIEDARVVTLATDVATLVYRVTAKRKGSEAYEALISSTYVRDGNWKLVIHQHTPL